MASYRVDRTMAERIEPDADLWPVLPTETEIYLLPDGRVIIADLPAELAELVVQLGMAEQAPTAALPPPPDEPI